MDLTKSMPTHVMPNLCFCIQWDPQVTKCISVPPESETLKHYFSYSGGTDTDLTKGTPRHVTLKFYFHPVGSVGHVVCSGESGQ
jgi:hypothetical protein